MRICVGVFTSTIWSGKPKGIIRLPGGSADNVAVKSTDVENMHIITRGKTPPNPSELLMHQRFTELVEWASQSYDLVIIDTPPVLAVTDPSIVGRHAGTTLMVTRFGVNSAKEIDAARGRFEHSGIDVKGVIFNAVEKKASSDYGYYSYEYKVKKYSIFYFN